MERTDICLSGSLALFPEEVYTFLWPFVVMSRDIWIGLRKGNKKRKNSM